MRHFGEYTPASRIKLDLSAFPAVQNSIVALNSSINGVNNASNSLLAKFDILTDQLPAGPLTSTLGSMKAELKSEYMGHISTLINPAPGAVGSVHTIAKEIADAAINVLTEGAAIDADTFLEMKNFIDENKGEIDAMANASRVYADQKYNLMVENEIGPLAQRLDDFETINDTKVDAFNYIRNIINIVIDHNVAVTKQIVSATPTNTPSVLLYEVGSPSRDLYDGVVLDTGDCWIISNDGTLYTALAQVDNADPFKLNFTLAPGETITNGVVFNLTGTILPVNETPAVY